MIKRKVDKHEKKIQQGLDRYGAILIKFIGVGGAIIGLYVLAAFWFWVIKMLYKIQ